MAGMVRGRAAGALALVVWGVAACYRQAAPAASAGLSGLERSVFPVFVADPTPRFVAMSDAFPRPRTRACGGVYVAPHVLATSAAAYPPATRAFDLGDTTVLDGSEALEVLRVHEVEGTPGLVLLRTREPGEPVVLRAGPVSPGEPLHRVAYRFHREPHALRVRAEWDVADGVALVEGAFGRTFRVRTALHPGVCGAALLDARGRLAGLVHSGGGEVAAVLDADAIRRALDGVGIAP
jgi:hypothetical protein